MSFGAALGRVGFGVCLLGCMVLQAVAQQAVPPLTAHVIDQTGTLTVQQQSALEQTLAAYEARKGTQLAVLIVSTTQPEVIEQYALRVAELWKLGRKQVDDGLILVVAKDDRVVRIEVGYGLEGAMPDITSKRIIDEYMLPRFRQGDFHGGIQAGMDHIIRVVDGEPLPAPVGAEKGTDMRRADGLWQHAPALLILALVVGGALRRVMGRPLGSVFTGAVVSVVAWFLIGALGMALLAGVAALLFTLVGGLPGRGGGGGMLGGGRGGFGGGGFRGGGGGFGGGGASGRW